MITEKIAKTAQNILQRYQMQQMHTKLETGMKAVVKSNNPHFPHHFELKSEIQVVGHTVHQQFQKNVWECVLDDKRFWVLDSDLEPVQEPTEENTLLTSTTDK